MSWGSQTAETFLDGDKQVAREEGLTNGDGRLVTKTKKITKKNPRFTIRKKHNILKKEAYEMNS